MPTYKLTRDPKTGGLDGGEYLERAYAAAQRQSDRTGRSPAECFADAAVSVCKSHPQAYADWQDLLMADRNPRFREQLRAKRPDLYNAIADLHRVDALAARTPAPERLSADQVYANAADRVVEDEMGGDRSRLPEAFDVVGKRQPELLHNYLAQRNGAPAAESFADPNFPREDVGAVTMDVLSDLVSGLSTKDARATLLVMVKEGKSAFVIPALESAGVSLEPLKAAHAQLAREISPAESVVPGGGGKVEVVTNPSAFSSFPDGLEQFSLAELQAKLASGELTKNEQLQVAMALNRITEGALDSLLGKLTPKEAVKLRAWMQASTKTGTQPVDQGHDQPDEDENAAGLRAETFAYRQAEAFGTVESVLAGGPIKILPLGKFHRDDRVIDISESDLKAIEANAAKGLPQFRIPVNVNHQHDLGKVGTVGAVKYLPAGPDGAGLYGTVEWTAAGRQLIAEQKFDGVSAEVVWDKKDGSTYQDMRTGATVKGGVLTAIAVTNQPFFGHQHLAMFKE